MVSKSISRLRMKGLSLLDRELTIEIANALQEDLGGTRRATKTIMRWTGVSDTTARSWLFGNSSPSAANMIVLAANSKPVMKVVLKLTGYSKLAVGLELLVIETRLELTLQLVRDMLELDATSVANGERSGQG